MTSAYASVCSYARIRSKMLIYVRGTLGIRRVLSEYAAIRQCTLCYTQRPNFFFDIVKMYQRMRAYRIYMYVTHSLAIRTAYAGYARHTLDIRFIRKRYVTHTFVKPCSLEVRLKVVVVKCFSLICIHFLKWAYVMHTL